MLDLNKPQDAHVDQRLRGEPMIWLSSVRPDDRPHLVPVWFLWDGEHILIYSQPGKQKVRNLQHSQHVVLALDTADDGGDVVIIEGTAELLDPAGPTMNLPAFVEKYKTQMQLMQSDPEALAKEYSQGIRVTPTKFISWSD